MWRSALAYLGAAAALAVLLHGDNVAVKAAALAGVGTLELGLALRARRLRELIAGDAIITSLITALLAVSPATFAIYRWGWLAHALAVTALLVLCSQNEPETTRARRASPLQRIQDWGNHRVYWVLVGSSGIALPAALLLLPPHYTLVDLALALWTLGGLPLLGAGMLGSGDTPRLPRRVMLIAVVALGGVVSLRSVRAFPNFSATDEAMIVNYADTYARTGRVDSSLIPYPAPVVTGNLYVYAAALWLRAFPGDPFALRMLSTLAGFALLGVVFLAGRALDDALTGGTAAALLAVNLLWLAVSHVGRQEMALALVVWAAVWLSLAAQRRGSATLALVAGLAAALSADVHPLGALACAAMGTWWIWWGLRTGGSETRTRRVLSAFVLGGLAGTAYYVAAHVLPDPAYFIAGVRDELFSYGAEGSTPLGAMLARHAGYFAANPLEAGLLLACALAGLRTPAGRRIGVFVGVLIGLYTLLVADPNPYYPIVWMPGAALLAALGLRRLRAQWRAPVVVGLLAAFALNIGLIERHVRADWNARAVDAIEQTAARLPGGGRGLSETFFYLAEQSPQFTGFTFVNYAAANTGLSRWDVVDRINPEWIVTVQDETAFRPEFDVMSVEVPHMHLEIPDDALAARYHLTDSISTSVGVFQIWRRK